MLKIKRTIQDVILENLRQEKSKVNIIYGARQVGKTTLMQDIVRELGYKTLSINGDDLIYNDILSSQTRTKLESLVAGYEMICIDEAQRILNIGINLKILYDQFPHLKILVTGSSSFELANKVKESLTGRTYTYHLSPIAFSELSSSYNPFELHHEFLHNFLIYGSYPDVLLEKNMFEKKRKLEELTSSYLYKDILLLETLRYPEKLIKLLRLLAFQIGQQVSIHELANSLDLNRETVIRYICLLEQTFVIHRVSGFSRNLRNEVIKMDKIYFWDLGIRNTLIGNMHPIENRNDLGQLWENFLINERLKQGSYSHQYFYHYFWRTHARAEIDYIEDYDGILHAYEFKWGNKSAKVPPSFVGAYPESTFSLINQENYLDFVLRK